MREPLPVNAPEVMTFHVTPSALQNIVSVPDPTVTNIDPSDATAFPPLPNPVNLPGTPVQVWASELYQIELYGDRGSLPTTTHLAPFQATPFIVTRGFGGVTGAIHERPSELKTTVLEPVPTATHVDPFHATSVAIVGRTPPASDHELAFALHRIGTSPSPTATVKFSVTSSPANADVPAALVAMRNPFASTLIGVPPR
jgi:hypothetical protein